MLAPMEMYLFPIGPRLYLDMLRDEHDAAEWSAEHYGEAYHPRWESDEYREFCDRRDAADRDAQREEDHARGPEFCDCYECQCWQHAMGMIDMDR